MADAADLKSVVPKGRAGSTPALGTNLFNDLQSPIGRVLNLTTELTPLRGLS